MLLNALRLGALILILLVEAASVARARTRVLAPWPGIGDLLLIFVGVLIAVSFLWL